MVKVPMDVSVILEREVVVDHQVDFTGMHSMPEQVRGDKHTGIVTFAEEFIHHSSAGVLFQVARLNNAIIN